MDEPSHLHHIEGLHGEDPRRNVSAGDGDDAVARAYTTVEW